MSTDSELRSVIASLGADEQRVLLAIARRLAVGAKAYGRLDVHGDPRNWKREGTEEALDLAVYLSCALLREAGGA